MDDATLDALAAMMETVVGEVNTSMPGVIVSYDPATNRAVVKPSLSKRLANGEDLPPPDIVNVPISWPAGSGGHMTFPLKPGDGVNLHFSQRALDGWLDGTGEAPGNPRQYDLTDATATPGMAPVGISGDPTAARISYGGSTVRMQDNGTVEVKTAGGTFTLDASGKFSLNAPGGFEVTSPTFTHNGKDVGATHQHRGVQTGGSLTGVPN